MSAAEILGMASPGPFALRPVVGPDVPVLAALHALSFADGLGGEVWSAAAIERILDLPTSFGILATEPVEPAGAPVPLGFALGRRAVDEAEVLTLGVVPTARRRGLARALLAALMAQAAAGDARRLYLEVAEDNRAALALYAQAGLSEVGRRPGYYRRAGARADALVLACDLIAPDILSD